MHLKQFHRTDDSERAVVSITVDGEDRSALAGDTLLTAILTNGRRVRLSEHGDGPRAGFCLIGACQDCVVTLGDGRRVRACTTYAADGMRVLTGWTPAHG